MEDEKAKQPSLDEQEGQPPVQDENGDDSGSSPKDDEWKLESLDDDVSYVPNKLRRFLGWDFVKFFLLLMLLLMIYAFFNDHYFK